MTVQAHDDDTRLYAIGDVHGRLDLLEQVIEAIGRDFAAHPGKALTITLGDYIDRGPQSRGVIERLAGNPFPTPYIALKGNHEAIFEAFLSDPKVGEHWRRLGGVETLASFGVSVQEFMRGRSYDETSRKLRAALTEQQVGFFEGLQPSFTASRYFFCHAGVRPGVPLARQDEDDLLWIREEFLESSADFGKIIVHGHTPVIAPDVRPNRINIDTGAFATGRLTCLVLEDGEYRFLT